MFVVDVGWWIDVGVVVDVGWWFDFGVVDDVDDVMLMMLLRPKSVDFGPIWEQRRTLQSSGTIPNTSTNCFTLSPFPSPFSPLRWWCWICLFVVLVVLVVMVVIVCCACLFVVLVVVVIVWLSDLVVVFCLVMPEIWCWWWCGWCCWWCWMIWWWCGWMMLLMSGEIWCLECLLLMLGDDLMLVMLLLMLGEIWCW